MRAVTSWRHPCPMRHVLFFSNTLSSQKNTFIFPISMYIYFTFYGDIGKLISKKNYCCAGRGQYDRRKGKQSTYRRTRFRCVPLAAILSITQARAFLGAVSPSSLASSAFRLLPLVSPNGDGLLDRDLERVERSGTWRVSEPVGTGVFLRPRGFLGGGTSKAANC